MKNKKYEILKSLVSNCVHIAVRGSGNVLQLV